ncbi:hypothetical protein [Sphingomonas sp.]|uniref:hypothetical protein n=1 Tax=Sphingomonas sp. TaxID=28214 RepID=UPI001ED011D7|nr:hypothetical protein [Sphingomonas sp.]MBX3594674.1 hypothetical protein [Sphingomonas sp.]
MAWMNGSSASFAPVAAIAMLALAPGTAMAETVLTDRQLAEVKVELAKTERQCATTGMDLGVDGRPNLLFSCRVQYWMSFNMAMAGGRLDLMEWIAASFRRAAGDALEEGGNALYWALMNAQIAGIRSRVVEQDQWMTRAMQRISRLDSFTATLLIDYANTIEARGRVAQAAVIWRQVQAYLQTASLPPRLRVEFTVALARHAFGQSRFDDARRYLSVAVATYDAGTPKSDFAHNDGGWLDILMLRAILELRDRRIDAASADLADAERIARGARSFDRTALLRVLFHRRTIAELRGEVTAYLALSRQIRELVIAGTSPRDAARADADIGLGKALLASGDPAGSRHFLKSGIAMRLATIADQPAFGAAEQQTLRDLRETMKFQIFADWILAARQRARD